MNRQEDIEKKLNPFYSISPKDISKKFNLRNLDEVEKNLSTSSIESDRGNIRISSSPRLSYLTLIENELRKVKINTKISSQSDLLKAVKKLVSSTLQNTLPCQSCKDRIETIEKLTNSIQVQKQTAIDEIEKLREMKNQVKKFEIVLKNKEKNLESERTNLAEKNEILEKKLKIFEQNQKILDNEKAKLKEEKKKLDEEKTEFVKKFKKLDEHFLSTSKEMQCRDSVAAHETLQKEKVDLAIKTEMLNSLSLEVDKKQRLVQEVVERFAEMKGRLEENQRNMQKIVEEKLSQGEKHEVLTKGKILKLKTRLKTVEDKLKEFQDRQSENSYQREDPTERYNHINLNLREQDEKDLKLQEYKRRCEKLEESLNHRNFEAVPTAVLERARLNEIKEKELKELEDNLENEKAEIAKTAEMLQELYLQLEVQQNALSLEKQLVESEKETNEKFIEKEFKNLDEKKAVKGGNPFSELKTLDLGSLPVFANRESLHFNEENMVIRFNNINK